MKKNVEKTGKHFPKVFLYYIHQIYTLVQKHVDKKLSEAKTLSFSQYWVLVCFIDCKDETKQTASEVAKKMHITEATLSRHVERLLSDKLIEKKQDPQNRRKFILKLTAKGLQKFNTAREIIDEELGKVFGVVAESDRKEVINGFEQVLAKLIETK